MNEEKNRDNQVITDLIEAIQSIANRLDAGEREQRETIESLDGLKDKLTRLPGQLAAQADRQQTILERFPTTIEVKIRHRFEGRTRVFALVFMASLIITSITIGLWYGSWKENGRLKSSDLKYRFQLLTQPQTALHTDTLYSRDPVGFRRMVAQMEAEEKALEQAEAAAQKEKEEARKAQENVELLRERTTLK